MIIPFAQRQFRQKPYSRCFQCILSPKLKCTKCMNQLVRNIIAQKQTQKQQKEAMKKHKQTHSQPIFNKNVENKMGDQFQITSKYGMWMEGVISQHRSMRDGSCRVDQTKYKRCLKAKQKIIRVQKARFESWEERLKMRLAKHSSSIDFFSNASRVV